MSVIQKFVCAALVVAALFYGNSRKLQVMAESAEDSESSCCGGGSGATCG